MVRKSWWQALEGHWSYVFLGRKEERRILLVSSLLFIQSRTPACELVATTINLIMTHMHAQRFISVVILVPVKGDINFNHQNSTFCQLDTQRNYFYTITFPTHVFITNNHLMMQTAFTLISYVQQS